MSVTGKDDHRAQHVSGHRGLGGSPRAGTTPAALPCALPESTLPGTLLGEDGLLPPGPASLLRADLNLNLSLWSTGAVSIMPPRRAL